MASIIRYTQHHITSVRHHHTRPRTSLVARSQAARSKVQRLAHSHLRQVVIHLIDVRACAADLELVKALPVVCDVATQLQAVGAVAHQAG